MGDNLLSVRSEELAEEQELAEELSQASSSLFHDGFLPSTPETATQSPAARLAALQTGLKRAAAALRGAGRIVADLVYPPSCLVCLAATAEPHALCASCWSRLRPIERPFCERLGTPFAVDLGPGLLSPAAVANPPVYERARAVARYDEAARALAHRLKYGDRLDLAATLSGWMARAGAELLRDADLIVPVPLHRRRLWARRFNQAALLAKGIGRQVGKPVAPFVLARRRHTRPQVGLTRAERLDNLSGAFLVPEEMKARIAGLRLLLVDDVLTTGSTVDAAARTLLRGGAQAVDVLVFARVVHDGNTLT